MSSITESKLFFGLEWRAVVTGTALFTAGFVARGFFTSPTRASVIESPRTTLLPGLSKQDISRLPYPPDAFPGARDVETPFGSIRVYEFGPEDGRKVVLVHGISTPCLSMGGVAHALVERGCRVIMFDLPGRGYSDTPTDIKQDIRFFTSQILLVLASSPLTWIGPDSSGVSLVGYSLGGGICASFASYFPDLVESLVLVAPAGLIRDHQISKTSRVLYSEGIIPEPLLHRLVRKRLQKPIAQPKKEVDAKKTGAGTAAAAEMDVKDGDQLVLSKTHPEITIEAAVNHQILHHEGFVHAFMSSMRYGPVLHQHDRWRRIGTRLTEKNKTASRKEKVLVVLGETDPVIDAQELQADATEVLQGNVEFKLLPAGHEVPVTKGDEIAQLIYDFWNDQR